MSKLLRLISRTCVSHQKNALKSNPSPFTAWLKINNTVIPVAQRQVKLLDDQSRQLKGNGKTKNEDEISTEGWRPAPESGPHLLLRISLVTSSLAHISRFRSSPTRVLSNFTTQWRPCLFLCPSHWDGEKWLGRVFTLRCSMGPDDAQGQGHYQTH